MNYDNVSHRRWNPLTQAWVLCSPHRSKRPWQGQVEKLAPNVKPQHDPKCFLCPRNARINGTPNPDFESTFTFPNDFPAVQAELPVEDDASPINTQDLDDKLFKAESTRGECHVICFHPHHNLTIAEMTPQQILPVIEAWSDIYKDFIAKPYIDYCQIFENKGEVMGCSNPHPHGQVWGTEQIPEEPRKEIDGLVKYRLENGGCCLLCDYAKAEISRKSRVVCHNDHFVCIVPWWAVWPFETMILARQHVRHLLEFSQEQKESLASIMRELSCRYDNLFECSFPYSMGLHQSPSVQDRESESVDIFHFHMHYYPPLLRSATVKKFQTGFEMLATPQRDLTSEQAAAKL
eukprot:Partr_v1_DN28270_c3_g1_i3_m75371 putative galactose-1-phosphate uridylyltransferase